MSVVADRSAVVDVCGMGDMYGVGDTRDVGDSVGGGFFVGGVLEVIKVGYPFGTSSIVGAGATLVVVLHSVACLPFGSVCA